MDYTTEAILEGIGMSNNDVLKYVYKKFFPVIRAFIENNNGDEEDARDLFQEAIIVIYRKMENEPVVLTCSFKTYIYSICRLLWLKQLEKRKDNNEINSGGIIDNKIDDSYEVYRIKTQKYRLYQKHFQRLSPDCKKVLQLALDKISLKEIAKIMGYKSEKYAKKRKYQCKKTLMENIMNDNDFKEVYDE